jgi:DNA-binding transcriptional LysR family regulator
VSQAVSELEKYYNVRLFDRISKRLFLTEAGKFLESYARHIVSLFQEMEQGSSPPRKTENQDRSEPDHRNRAASCPSCPMPGDFHSAISHLVIKNTRISRS